MSSCTASYHLILRGGCCRASSTWPFSGTGCQHHQETCTELARRQHSNVDRRIGAGYLPGNHEHEREGANDRDTDDEGGAEPVIIEPPIKHDLQRAEEPWIGRRASRRRGSTSMTMASVIPAYRNAFRPMRSSAQISPSTNTPAPNAAKFCAAYAVSSLQIIVAGLQLPKFPNFEG
jgi:hypothetical protein